MAELVEHEGDLCQTHGKRIEVEWLSERGSRGSYERPLCYVKQGGVASTAKEQRLTGCAALLLVLFLSKGVLHVLASHGIAFVYASRGLQAVFGPQREQNESEKASIDLRVSCDLKCIGLTF